VNCTFLDALGGREHDYLIARALQFFAPGIPQVYYVGLLGGRNDMRLLSRSHVGRDINRHYYQAAEIKSALASSLVQKQLELIRIRNTHPGFAGDMNVNVPKDHQIEITWKREKDWIKLLVDLSAPSASITGTTPKGESKLMEIGVKS
jgi:sucrose phosphorylase